MQAIDLAQLREHQLAELQAIVNLRGLGKIKQCARKESVLQTQVHATDQVGFVFSIRQPLCGRRCRTTFRQGKHRGSIRIRMDVRVCMQADKKIRAQAARALHPLLQRHKKIRIAGKRNPKAVVVVQFSLEQFGDDEHDVLLARATPSDRAWILAPVARIQHDDDGSRLPDATRDGRRSIWFCLSRFINARIARDDGSFVLRGRDRVRHFLLLFWR